MKSKILIVLLLLNNSLFGSTLIVAPEAERISLYVNSDVGSTIKFPKEVKLITPRLYYVVEKQETNPKYLYVTAKRGAIREPVTIESGSDILHFNLIPSKNAERFIKILIASDDPKKSRRENILETIVNGKAVANVTRESLDGDPVTVAHQKLKPVALYSSLPYIGVIFEKIDKSPEGFDFRHITIGPSDAEVWSFESGNYLTFIFDDRKNLNVNTIRLTLREKKSSKSSHRQHHRNR